MSAQLTLCSVDYECRHEPTKEEMLERRRLELAWEAETARRKDRLRLEGEQRNWRYRADEAARRRGMTAAQRAFEDECNKILKEAYARLEESVP